MTEKPQYSYFRFGTSNPVRATHGVVEGVFSETEAPNSETGELERNMSLHSRLDGDDVTEIDETEFNTLLAAFQEKKRFSKAEMNL